MGAPGARRARRRRRLTRRAATGPLRRSERRHDHPERLPRSATRPAHVLAGARQRDDPVARQRAVRRLVAGDAAGRRQDAHRAGLVGPQRRRAQSEADRGGTAAARAAGDAAARARRAEIAEQLATPVRAQRLLRHMRLGVHQRAGVQQPQGDRGVCGVRRHRGPAAAGGGKAGYADVVLERRAARRLGLEHRQNERNSCNFHNQAARPAPRGPGEGGCGRRRSHGVLGNASWEHGARQ